MVDTSGVFVNLAPSMTGKTRNRLTALFILAFPFAVFLAFLIHELNSPRPSARPRPLPNGPIAVTNAVPPAPSAGTNLDYPQPR